MLLSYNEKIINTDLEQLCELLIMIDTKLFDLDNYISKSLDPDSDGLFDRGEYFIGVGFVAIQQHLNESLIGININKKELYSLGPIHSSGYSSIWVINASANWWKHESEWFKNNEVPKNARKTIEIITAISKQHEYALSGVLASFSESNSLSFMQNIIPHIEIWNKEVSIKT